MNIFYFNIDPVKNAQMLCNKHIGKMLLETAQLLCGVHDSAPYKRTHYNHPCAKWARKSIENYLWLGMYGKELCREYTHRYGKIHKSESVIDWCINHAPQLHGVFSEPPTITGTYSNYIDYYLGKNMRMSWTKRNIPIEFMR